MSVERLIVIAMGIGFVAYGYRRARFFWNDYQALAAQQENAERYARWRGGVRDEQTGPSEAMRDLRRRAAVYGLVAVFGFLFIFQGFSLR